MKRIGNKEGRDALIYVASNALIQCGNLIVIPLFWRRLTPEDYGVIAITEIIGAFLGIFLGLSLEQSINKFYYQWTEEQRKRGIGAIWVVSWSSSIILGIVSLIVLSYITEYMFSNVKFYPYVFAGVTGIIVNSLSLITFTTIRIRRVPWLYSIYSLYVFCVYIVLRMYFVLFENQGLIGYFKANIVGASVIAVVTIFIMARFAKPCLRNAGIYASLKFSLPMIPSTIISVTTAVSDRFILQSLSSLSTLGIYSISIKFASIITALHDGIKSSYGPYLWQVINQETDAGRKIASSASVFMIPIFTAGIFISLFIRDIINIIDRPLYYPVSEFVPLVAGFTIISCLYIYYSPGMMLGGRTDLLWIPASLQLFALFVGVISFKQFGVYGIIAAKYAAATIYFSVSYYLSQKSYFIPHKLNKLFLVSCLYLVMLLGFNFVAVGNNLLLVIIKIFTLLSFIAISFTLCKNNKNEYGYNILGVLQRYKSR